MNTHNRFFILRCLLIVALMPMCLTACGIFRGRSGGSHGGPGSAGVEPMSQEEYEQLLRAAVRERINDVGMSAEDANARFESRKPYFYKVYEYYSEGPDAFKIDIQETESRTIPYRAQATLKKVRFSTQLHRDKDLARRDNNFSRHTGTETLSYELRSGNWVKAGSLFLAEKSERKDAAGRWVAIERAARPEFSASEAPSASDKKGWFSRALDKATFWN